MPAHHMSLYLVIEDTKGWNEVDIHPLEKKHEAQHEYTTRINRRSSQARAVRNSPQGISGYPVGRPVCGSELHPRKRRNYHPRWPGGRSGRVVWLAQESA